ncbi:MAG: ABC transporter substrate-binding protein [Acidimicrobiaceae bacterium]|nr:ABC transporter substrate-binding protein [Acidimicrobiaceae bacterium]
MAARRIDRRWRRRLAAVLVCSLAASACGGGGGPSSPAAEPDGDAAPAGEPDLPDAVGSDDGAGGAPAATGNEPDDVGEQELLVAPVDTTTTTTAPAPDGDGGGTAAGEPAEPEPRSGGTLRVAILAEGDGLNPAANSLSGPVYNIAYSVFDPLAYYDTGGNWVPVLAESWTRIGDGTSWQMKVREGIRFHDGTELDADDVIATFGAQLADPVISVAFRPGFDPDAPVVKIDDYTVQFKGVRPSARLPIAFTSQLGMILPSEWLEQAAADPSLNQTPVGTGPFMVESRILGESTVLVRNPDYWAADMIDIHLDRIEVQPITDSTIAAQRLIAGELDLIVVSGAEAILALRDAADQGVRTVENQRSEESLMIINAASPVFSDIRARQALTFATDQDLYADLIRQGTTPVAHTMFHPDLVWRNPDVEQETNMPEKAGPLVESYCADSPQNCSDGRINMRFGTPGPSVESDRAVDLLADTWDEFFNLDTTVEPLSEMIVDVVLGNYDVVLVPAFGAVDPDNDAIFMECGAIGPAISLNFARYCDEERDELLYEQRRIDDLDRRVEIWHRIQEMNRDAYIYIFMTHDNWTIGARDNVENICGQVSPDGVELFCNNQGRIWLNQLRLG